MFFGEIMELVAILAAHSRFQNTTPIWSDMGFEEMLRLAEWLLEYHQSQIKVMDPFEKDILTGLRVMTKK